MIEPSMVSPDIEIPSRAPAATSLDDTVMPFEVASLDLRGRVVRLGPLVDEILAKHAYPEPVAKLLAEAIVLTVMLGSALKMEGRFILQTQTDGPVGLLVVDYTTPGKVRACARFGKDGVAAAVAAGRADAGTLLGKGHLAMTIDQGASTSRYQGLVALDGGSLEDAAHEYFLRSEQIPTRVRLAVAEELVPGAGTAKHRWRAGGIMLQFLPKSAERARIDLDPGDAPEGIEIAAGPPGGQRVIPGVDEIRPGLVPADDVPGRADRRHEPGGDGRLPLPGGRGGDDKPGQCPPKRGLPGRGPPGRRYHSIPFCPF